MSLRLSRDERKLYSTNDNCTCVATKTFVLFYFVLVPLPAVRSENKGVVGRGRVSYWQEICKILNNFRSIEVLSI